MSVLAGNRGGSTFAEIVNFCLNFDQNQIKLLTMVSFILRLKFSAKILKKQHSFSHKIGIK